MQYTYGTRGWLAEFQIHEVVGGKQWTTNIGHRRRPVSTFWCSGEMSNERAETLLRALGFTLEPEPAWVIGLNPDFYCSGPLDLWVEVKTLAAEERFERLADAHKQLRKRLGRISSKAQALAWVRPPLQAGDAKAIAALVQREVARLDFGANDAEHLVVVPDQPINGRFVRFVFEMANGKRAIVSAVESKNGKYGWPMVFEPKNYHETIAFKRSDGTCQTVRLREIATLTDNVRVAIELRADENRFNLISTTPVGVAADIGNVERIREAVSEANAQHKNGCRHRDAPSLTVIYHNDLTVADNKVLLAALYGDLAYAFSPGNFQNGELHLTRNGVFRPDKNTTTSAVCYIRNDTSAVYVHNFWAARRLPTNLFCGKHFVPKPDGGFQDIAVSS